MCEARLRGVEERVRGVPPARRRREAERVRHELGAVVEREAGIFCEIPGKICGEFALISSARVVSRPLRPQLRGRGVSFGNRRERHRSAKDDGPARRLEFAHFVRLLCSSTSLIDKHS